MRYAIRNGLTLAALGLSALVLTGCGDAGPREQIHIVGSSTVHPFSSRVAEAFGATTRFEKPKVESTGSGAGHKYWGEGPGLSTPDLTNSSRRMKVKEFKRATQNGIQSITEAKIGYDGIVLAQHVNNEAINLTRKQLALAVLKKVPGPEGGLIDNPHEKWSDIDASLPDRAIEVHGPPTTSGTRDAFEELVLEHATEQMDAYDGAYTQVRTDGDYWVAEGEDDNLIVNELASNKTGFGIFGYSFLDENRSRVQPASIEGVKPRPEAISSGEYPISRSLFFYIKNNRRGQIKGFERFLETFMSDEMIGKDGTLSEIGLIPLPPKQLEASRQRVMEGSQLQLKDGKLTSLADYMAGAERPGGHQSASQPTEKPEGGQKTGDDNG